MHAEGGFRPMLFDLQTDPEEFHDLAKDDAHTAELDRLYRYLAEWGRRMSQRVTKSPEELLVKYRGPVRQRYDESK